jgi:broad specificity phosphatase PhoE
MKLKKQLYLIRHGETDYNRRGIVQGKGVNSSLNEVGRSQAQKFYDAYKNEGFDRIYISTLQRTRESIEPFTHTSIPIESHEGLDEISWGIHEGQESGDSFKEFHSLLKTWKAGDIHASIQDGESPFTVQQRQLLFLDYLRQTKDERILLCSHGRSMRILLCTLLGEPLQHMDRFPHHNLCLYRLQWDGEFTSIELFNDLSHLGK